MSEGMNRAILVGNLGADPELRFTQGGQAVLNIRLATTESFRDKDDKIQERTEWHSVVVWGKRGEGLSKILHKGDRIAVEGGIRTSSYEGKDGEKRYKTEIHATNVVLCGGGRGSSESRQSSDDRGERARPDDRGGRQDSRRDERRDDRRGSARDY